MNDLLETVDALRRMSTEELIRVGEDSLLNRIREQAEEARARHGALSPSNMQTFLEDPDCLRYPTRLVLEYGEMGMHQFAQPEPDYRNPGGCMLYVRPVLGQRPDLLALAVSYMIPVINYGEIIADRHCLAYGSTLMGLDQETYYERICEAADYTGARVLGADDPDAHVPKDTDAESPAAVGGGGGCGSGCGCHS